MSSLKNFDDTQGSESLGILFYFFVLSYGLILFAPRIFGNFRVEDILMPFFLVIPLLVRISPEVSKILLFFLIYIAYEFASTLLGFSLALVPIDAYLLVGKELQYFLLYFLFFATFYNKLNKLKLFLSYFSVIFFISILWAFLSVIFFTGYYGISWVNEISPSLSALIYFNLFILSIVCIYARVGNFKVNIFLSLLLFFCTFLVGSRSAMVALPIFLLLLWFLQISISSKIIFSSLAFSVVLFFTIYPLDLLDIQQNIEFLVGEEGPLQNVVERFSTLIFILDALDQSEEIVGIIG